MCPSGYDIAELYIFLREPCYLTEISLTILHGNNDETSPGMIDLFIGPYLDKMTVIYQGLHIPRCASGTQLYYMIPSSMWKAYEGNSRIYDFDIGADSYVSPFTRIVQIIFRGIPSDYHMTLGKVDLYGILSARANNLSPKEAMNKLRQRNVSDKVDTILSHLSKTSKSSESHSSLLSSLSSPIQIQAEESVTSIEKSFESDTLQEPSVTRTSNALETLPSKDSLSSRDNPNELPKETMNTLNTEISNAATMDISVNIATDDDTKLYELKVKEKLNSGVPLTFLDALELEYLRLAKKISPQQRDAILLELRTPTLSNILEYFNPDRFAYLRNEKTELMLRKSSIYKSNKCRGCNESLGILRNRQCYYCYFKFCGNCMASSPAMIIEFMWEKPQLVCKNCSQILSKQDDLLKKIRKLAEQWKLEGFKERDDRRFSEMLLAVHSAQQYSSVKYTSMSENPTTMTSSSSQESSQSSSISEVPLTNLATKNDEEREILASLAEYPYAGILISVPSKRTSPPIESILFPVGLVPIETHWSAPSKLHSTQIIIVLSQEAILEKWSFLVDPIGYRAYDIPSFDVLAGTNIANLRSCGSWNLAAFANSEGEIQPGHYMNFSLDKPVSGRLLSFQLSLPEIDATITKEKKRSFLHLGRIFVYGTIVNSSCTPLYSNPHLSFSPQDMALYDCTRNTLLPKIRTQIRPLWIQNRSGQKILDICINPVPIAGFSVLIRHSEKGSSSQTKLMRVVGVINDSKGEMQSLRQIVRVILPRVRSGAELFYDLTETITVNIVTFEFLNSYGSTELVPPKIALYC